MKTQLCIHTFLHLQNNIVMILRTNNTARVEKTGIRNDSLNTATAMVTSEIQEG